MVETRVGCILLALVMKVERCYIRIEIDVYVGNRVPYKLLGKISVCVCVYDMYVRGI